MMFKKYNMALKHRSNAQGHIDLTSLRYIEDSNEQLMAKMDGESNDKKELVFEIDNLTLEVVAKANGVRGLVYQTWLTKRKM